MNRFNPQIKRLQGKDEKNHGLCKIAGIVADTGPSG